MLGDDALHLAAIALVDEPRSPVHQRVAASDQGGKSGDPALDQLASVDGLAVSPAKVGPGQHVGQHDAHAAGGAGAQRQAAEIQAVISNSQAVADLRHEQIGTWDAEPIEEQAVVVRLAQRVQAVSSQLELFGFHRRQFGDQHRRLAFQDNDEADGPAGNDVGNEELFASHLELVAF
jgi:hypothetical protein